MFSCSLCPRQCAATRGTDHGDGFCGLPETAYLAHAALHTGEEPCLGTAGAIFFAGCTLRCAYCQNHTISRKAAGNPVTAQRLSDVFRDLCDQGANVIDLVSPTPYLPIIRKALLLYRPPVPVVYNTSGYERTEILRSLEGLIDVYLPDLKYVTSALATDLSGAADYPQYALPAIREMVRQTGTMTIGDNGIAIRGTLVRHLVLPGHTKESLAVLDALAKIPDIWVSLMSQYTPVVPVDGHPELSRRVTKREYEKVTDHLFALGMTNGYLQDRASATTAYIPAFDGTGVPFRSVYTTQL
ncbi:MAG: radical SAM protein [Clostridia bacterium]|nr:radical SAM protein [Clostridia bacterium]